MTHTSIEQKNADWIIGAINERLQAQLKELQWKGVFTTTFTLNEKDPVNMDNIQNIVKNTFHTHTHNHPYKKYSAETKIVGVNQIEVVFEYEDIRVKQRALEHIYIECEVLK